MRRTSIRRWWGALFRLAFAAPTPTGLSSLDTPTRWPIIQKVRRHPMKRLGLLVGIRFQVSFTPLVRVLRSGEQPSDLQSIMRISYAVFCLKRKQYNKDSTKRQAEPRQHQHLNTSHVSTTRTH